MSARRRKPRGKTTETAPHRLTTFALVAALVVSAGGIAALGWRRHQRQVTAPTPAPPTESARQPASPSGKPAPARSSWTALEGDAPKPPTSEPVVVPQRPAPSEDLTAPRRPEPRRNAEPLWRQRARHY
ncbi:MAG TPA: hypothetical protein VGF45_10140 [Polyangia bacterium]